jgi:L,D-peptidoglycan transpeptidase YkuD (ErfK/YbiS/YcfS/YnhG family)
MPSTAPFPLPPVGLPEEELTRLLNTHKCVQLLAVQSPSPASITAQLSRYERSSTPSGWRQISHAIPVTLGRTGLAWGRGLHTNPDTSSLPIKQEGDGRSPAGLFQLPRAFGYAPPSPATADIGLPYIHLSETTVGVDDPHSLFYNQLTDDRHPLKDWSRSEVMRRPDGQYEWGLEVAHNLPPSATPGAGSCIFLHIWSAPGRPTEGCTALSRDDMRSILTWIKPGALLLQGLTSPDHHP